MSLLVFNPSLCHLLPFHLLCWFFNVMPLVGILPHRPLLCRNSGLPPDLSFYIPNILFFVCV